MSWNRVVVRRIGHVVAVLGAAAWSQPAASGADLWWHLAAGREIWALGGPPSVDHFSFTFEGRPWLNHEWLWDAVFWGLYRLVPQSVAWLNLALVVGVLAVVYAVARRESGSMLAAGAALWAGAATSHWFFDIRPHVTSLLLVAIVLNTREIPRRVWLWPVLMVVWANLHGGFVFGVGMIGLCASIRTVEQSLAAGRLTIPRADRIAVGLCLVAWLVTPWGFTSLDYPLQYLNSHSPYRSILEWQPPGFSYDLRDYRARFWLLALLTAAGMAVGFKRSPDLVGFASVSFAMAVTSRRFIPLFAVTAAPLVALALAEIQRRVMARWPGLSGLRAQTAATAIALVVAAFLWRDVRLFPRLLERWTATDLFPTDALLYLEALGTPRRLLNESSWGGYVMLHLPGARVFIDGRANTLYDDAAFLETRALRTASPGLPDRLARWTPDAALIETGSRLHQALVALPEPWIEVYRDSLAVVLLPPDSPRLKEPRPDLAQVLSETVGSYEHRAMAAISAEDAAGAFEAVEGAIARDPLTIRAYGQLMLLHAARHDYASLQRTLEAGLRENPRRWIDLNLAEGAAYERAGELQRALAAYQRAVSTAPFASPDATLRKIQALEAQIRGARTTGDGAGRGGSTQGSTPASASIENSQPA